MKIPDRTLAYATDEFDHALSSLIPHATEEEIRALFEEQLRIMSDAYQDFLSLPDV